MKRLESLKLHHLLIGAIAAVLVWLVACGGQLPASLGGGALGNGSDPGTAPPACSAAQGSPDASPDPGCSRPGDGAGMRHSHGHGHGHGHGHHGRHHDRCGCRDHHHGHRHHHADDDRDQASTSGHSHDAAAPTDRLTAGAPTAPSRA